jgi:hypothetical protein
VREAFVSLVGAVPEPSTRGNGAVVGTPVDTARHGELQGPGPDRCRIPRV